MTNIPNEATLVARVAEIRGWRGARNNRSQFTSVPPDSEPPHGWVLVPCAVLPPVSRGWSTQEVVTQAMNELGLALIPQSVDDDGFRWLATDVAWVTYNAEHYGEYGYFINPREERGAYYSGRTIVEAVCVAYLAHHGQDPLHEE